MNNDKKRFLAGCEKLSIDMPQEKLEKIDIYVDTLLKWQKQINLIGPKTLSEPYTRHVLDSIQLIPFINDDDKLVDFGSGGGMPAALVAIMKNCEVNAVERNGKKCQFLNEVRRRCDLSDNFNVHNCDIRALYDNETSYSVVTARAFADLNDILEFAAPITGVDTRYVLLKGGQFSKEIEHASTNFMMTSDVKESITNSEGKVLLLTSVSRET